MKDLLTWIMTNAVVEQHSKQYRNIAVKKVQYCKKGNY